MSDAPANVGTKFGGGKNYNQKQIVAKLSAVQDYKKQLLAQRAKLKELFDSVLYKSMQQK